MSAPDAAVTVDANRRELVADELYALLPPYLRTQDAANGWALRALVEVLAIGSAEVDQEIERLYAAQFVETAPEEALADFAALIAAEPLRPLPEGTPATTRAYLANTIRYRRGKGTARVLEALATDVGGFAAIAVEYFQRLARLQHVYDVRPERPGLARLTAGETAALTGTAQDRLPRLAEFRAMARGGKHHVPNVGVHLLRPQVPFFAGPADLAGIAARQLDGVPVAQPWKKGATALPGYFQLSAQAGRPLRLFNPDRRSQDEGVRPVVQDLPDRLRRLPLHLETEELRNAPAEGRQPRLSAQPWFDALGRPFAIYVRRKNAATFDRIPPDRLRICRLEDFPTPAGVRPARELVHTWGYDASKTPPVRTAKLPVECGFDPATGRMIFPKPASGKPDVEEVRVAYGTGIGLPIGAGAQNRNAPDIPLDVTDGGDDRQFVCVVDGTLAAGSGSALDSFLQVPSLKDALDAWDAAVAPGGADAPSRGVIVCIRCDRLAVTQLTVHVPTGSRLEIVAGRWIEPETGPDVPVVEERRGFIERVGRRFTIDAKVRVQPVAIAGRDTPGTLAFDGIEMTGGIELGGGALAELHLRHVTLRRPGNPALTSTDPLFEFVLRAERCVLGRIAPADGEQSAGSRLVISDSVVSADEAAGPAIDAPRYDVELTDVTVLGDATARVIEATNAIFAGTLTAARTQAGCLRYSYVEPGPNLPRRFRCQPELALAAAAEAKNAALTDDEREVVAFSARPRFLDTALDEPCFAMLHPRCSEAIRHGGEGETEMGAMALSADALRMDNVTRFFTDYLPFGLDAALTDDTRSAAVAARRNTP
jgi:hypothetical protein